MELPKNINELCDNIIEKQGHDTLFLSFSRGKDSIASFLRLYETGKFKNYFLYHYYIIPGLSFIDDYIDYFEQKYDLKIVQVPSPTLYNLLNAGVLQSPLHIRALDKLYKQEGQIFVKYTLTDLMNAVKDSYLLPDPTYCAIGVSMYDSMMRRTAIKKYGVINENLKKWYPIWGYKHSDIKEIMKKHDVRYPDDYELFGLSFDGLDYRFLKVIQEKRPEDYKKIKEIFPLIDLVIQKREHYFGKNIKRSKFNYKS